jgi:tRNA-dihydrouridine synthase
MEMGGLGRRICAAPMMDWTDSQVLDLLVNDLRVSKSLCTSSVAASSGSLQVFKTSSLASTMYASRVTSSSRSAQPVATRKTLPAVLQNSVRSFECTVSFDAAIP